MKNNLEDKFNNLTSLSISEFKNFIADNFTKFSFKQIKEIVDLTIKSNIEINKEALLFFIFKYNENHEIYSNTNHFLSITDDIDFRFEKLVKYQVSLLNKYNKYDELKILQQSNTISRLTHLSFLNEKQSEAIINIELEKNSMYSFNVKGWKDAKISDWIEKNLDNPIEVLNKNSFYVNNLGKISKETFYNKLYDSFLLADTKSQVRILEIAPIDFWKFSMEKDPSIIINLLESKISFKMINNDERFLECNNLQKIMHKKYFTNIKDCNYIRSKFVNILNTNVILNNGEERTELSIFEYAKNYELKLILPFYKQKNITKEDKEAFLDAVFFFLQIQYDNTNIKLIGLSNKERELFKEWSVQSFLMADQNMLDQHFQKNIDNFSKSELNEIQNIYLFSDLQKSVDKKPKTTQKLKL